MVGWTYFRGSFGIPFSNYHLLFSDSCKGVRCRGGMQCIEFKDKTKMPYCVNCDRRLCTQTSNNSSVCGADNVTYSSHCELRMATCRRGKTIGIAYTGPCKGKRFRAQRIYTEETALIKYHNEKQRFTAFPKGHF